ncbi:MAG: ThiF family adenylyltransferase [Prevotellaceae bacterium]|jgi:adenylyltransferase/sulfurtransferase|nr:ThiF family adenylyltransferase [Prevotellaceae bacterium]
MKPSILSPGELKQFSRQIKALEPGIEGQEKLKYSEVIINGMDGIGIAVLRCLLAAGIGRIKIIDNRTVNEDMLPSQTLFGMNDYGKLRTLAARQNNIDGLNKNVTVLNTVMTSDNVDRLIGNAKVVIEILQSNQLALNLIDLADKKGFYLAGGFGIDWKGAYGIYCGNNKEKYKETVTSLFQHLHPYDNEQAYFSFISNIIGGAIAGKTIKALLNIGKEQSSLYEVNMLDFKIIPHLGNY